MKGVKVSIPAQPQKFFDQFRAFIRLDGKSYATENTYVYWVRQYILYHRKQHPYSMGAGEVKGYLSHLALKQNTSPNTQKTALNALMFMYNRFLKQPIENLDFSYAKKTARTPVVFTHQEAMSVISNMHMPYQLMAKLMYGSGLRISDVRFRVKDVDFGMGYITVATLSAIHSPRVCCKPNMI